MTRRYFLPVLCALILMGSLALSNTASAQTCCVLTGDANDDATVTSSDIIYLVNYVFKGGAAPDCIEHGDANGDETITSSDIIYLVNFVFKGGPLPVDCPISVPYVFIDEYGPGVTYQAFEGSFLEGVEIVSESEFVYAGTQGLGVVIPNVDPFYTGGAFVDTSGTRDLSGVNALTFWAKSIATGETIMDVVGVGNDNTGTSKYIAEVNGLSLTSDWQKFVIPIPDPSRLTEERGLFHFAEGTNGELLYTIWIDEIIFEDLSTITNPRPALNSKTIDVAVGETIDVGNHVVTFDVDGSDVVVNAMPGYFTFTSSDPAIVSVSPEGVITAEAPGTATLTAELQAVAATGSITVNVSPPEPVPTVPAPTPTVNPDSVISLFSDAYTDVPVDTWSTGWDNANVEDYLIGPDSTKKYTNLVFAGIEFLNPVVDASTMTHIHMDIWTPNSVAAPAVFRIKLVNDVLGTVSESELTFSAVSNPPLVSEDWIGFDIPLSAFGGLADTDKLGQLIISSEATAGPKTVYVDNVYFYDSGQPTEPEISAPTPDKDPSVVISLFSDAYTDVPVDTWSAVWDLADVADFVLGADNMKQYTNLQFAGIEFWNPGPVVDASNMTHFHMDYWTADASAAPAVFKIKLVDFGADGSPGGGDDVEQELTYTDASSPALATGSWVSFDIPLSDFAGLTTKGHLAQLIINSDPGPNTVFLDNIYFYNAEPPVSAPTPTPDPGDVISLLSDAYSNVPVDTWSTDWDNCVVGDFVLGGTDSMKQYSSFVFAGIEFVGPNTIDATGMTHFHMDYWTPNTVASPAVFKIKLVDFGADNAFGGGDDREHELTFTDATSPSLAGGTWVSFDIPLANFTGLTTKGNLAQMILVSDPGPNTVFLDNIYFYDAGAPTEPPVAAPTPTENPADVISLFSGTYSSEPVDTWLTGWSSAGLTDFLFSGTDSMKQYTSLVFAGIEFVGANSIDATAMTHFHVDYWTADGTTAPAVFKIKLVDFGADNAFGGGDDVEHELVYSAATTPALATGGWVSFDIPLADFANLTTKGHLSQLIFNSDPGPNTVFLDNIYFHK